MTDFTDAAQKIISDLREDGFTDGQIKAAMTDGEYLAKAGIDQDTAEEIFNAIED